MKKIFYTSGILEKVLSCYFSIFISAITIVLCIFIEQVGVPPIIFSVLYTIFGYFGTYLCWNVYIKIDKDNNLIVIKNLRTNKYNLQDLVDIKVITQNSINQKKYCNIRFEFINRTSFEMSGVNSLIKYKDTEKTNRLVAEIKKYINT